MCTYKYTQIHDMMVVYTIWSLAIKTHKPKTMIEIEEVTGMKYTHFEAIHTHTSTIYAK